MPCLLTVGLRRANPIETSGAAGDRAARRVGAAELPSR